jgi:hypothetical protein
MQMEQLFQSEEAQQTWQELVSPAKKENRLEKALSEKANLMNAHSDLKLPLFHLNIQTPLSLIGKLSH